MERLRQIIVEAIRRAWGRLTGFDEENVDEWLTVAIPVTLAAQRQAVALTDAYLARALERPPLGVDVGALIGSAVRGGTPMEDVHRRPFVDIWSALKQGRGFDAGYANALDRVDATAAIDPQLSMRATFQTVQDADKGIYGYARQADSEACAFCRLVDGAYVKRADAMALHNRCGCGLRVLTEPHPLAAKLPSGVAVHEHGELGPVLTSPDHAFTSL